MTTALETAKDSPKVAASLPSMLPVHLALLLVQVAFGTLPVEGKIAMNPPYSVAPEALAMMRLLGGTLAFVPTYLISAQAPRVASVRDGLAMVVLAIFGVALNQALFLYGLSHTSPMSATLLIATIPIFTALIAVVTRRDRMTLQTGVGLALAVFGVLVLSNFSVPKSGDLFVLLNAASYAIYVVFSKSALARYGTLTVMAWIFGAATILFAPVGALALVHDAPRWSAGAWGYVAFVVLVPTVLAYALNAWALERATPTLVTIYIYFQPLVVLTLSTLQLHQTPKLASLFGGLFILAGVTTVALRKPPSSSQPRTKPV